MHRDIAGGFLFRACTLPVLARLPFPLFRSPLSLFSIPSTFAPRPLISPHLSLLLSQDDLYVLGVRVLLRSIRKTGTKEDLVCLIADNVRQSTRDYFAAEGCILKTVPNIPNPYKETQQLRRTYKPRFEFTFNKLYVWNLLEYERVMYLDADNVFLNNIDDLFYCGEFCVVFFNPSFFHTGMMVIKPDAKVFRRLLTNLLTFKTFSYDGADQGFLIAEFPQVG